MGLEVSGKLVYLADLYVNRLQPKSDGKQQSVSSISRASAPRSIQDPVAIPEWDTHVLGSRSWRVFPTYLSSKVTRERLGRHDSYWVELSDAYPNLDMIETKIDFPDTDDRFFRNGRGG